MLVAAALFTVCVRASIVHCIHLYRQFDPLAMLVRSRLNSLKKYSGVLRMLVPWENATPELLQEELALLQDLQQSMQIMPSAAEFMPCASPFYAVELLQDWLGISEKLLRSFERFERFCEILSSDEAGRDLTDQLTRLTRLKAILEEHRDETARFLDIHLHLTRERMEDVLRAE